jgi:hypothetical protein
MALMGWPAFHEAHYRPFMVFGDFLTIGVEPQFILVRRLTESMIFKGNYSLFPDKTCVRIAFELEADANILVRGLRGREVIREGEWAGQWAFDCSRIEALLKSTARKSSGKRSVSRKRKQRALPL